MQDLDLVQSEVLSFEKNLELNARIHLVKCVS